MKRPVEFTMTADHLALMRHMYVGWQDCETGAPEIDPKRPYGNSDVASDVADALGWVKFPEALPRHVRERAMTLHRETEVALQVALRTGRFQVGRYRRSHEYSTDWALLPEGQS